MNEKFSKSCVAIQQLEILSTSLCVDTHQWLPHQGAVTYARSPIAELRREILKIFIHKTLPYVRYNTKFTLRILAKFMNEMKRKNWHFVLCDGTVRKTFWVLSFRDVTHTSISKPAVTKKMCELYKARKRHNLQLSSLF